MRSTIPTPHGKPTTLIPRGPMVIMLALFAALLIAACGGSSSSGGSNRRNAAKTTSTGMTTAKTASAVRTELTACLKQAGVSLPAGAGGFGRFRGGAATTGTPPSGGFAGGANPPSDGRTTPSGGAGAGGSGGAGAGGTGAGGAGAEGAGAGGARAGGGFPGGGGFAGGFRNSKFAKAIAACDKKLGIKAGAGFGGAGRFGGGAGAVGGAGGRGFTPRISTATLKTYVACIRKNGYAAMPEPKATGTGAFFPKSVESNAGFKAANAKCQSILLKAFRAQRGGGGAGGPGGSGTVPKISGTSTVAHS